MKYCVLAVILLIVSTQAVFYRESAKKIIEEVNKKQNLWKAGENKAFENKTMDSIKSSLGALTEPEWMRLPEVQINTVAAVPTSFDSRLNWPNCQSIQEVRDQSNCGSCWAFGAVEAMSDRICVASNQTKQTRISSQNLVSCCGAFCGSGCNGGYPSQAWRYWVVTGLVTGDLYGNTSWCQPYSLPPCDHHCVGQYPPCNGTSATPSCSKSCIPQYTVNTYSQDIHKGKSAYAVSSNVEKIQTEILTNGPVEAAFTVYEDFLSYTSGVYVHTSGSALGGHAIKILGWGVSGNQPYWICANSWNQDWGMQGFFWILRGVNECGIESQVVAGLPQ